MASRWCALFLCQTSAQRTPCWIRARPPMCLPPFMHGGQLHDNRHDEDYPIWRLNNTDLLCHARFKRVPSLGLWRPGVLGESGLPYTPINSTYPSLPGSCIHRASRSSSGCHLTSFPPQCAGPTDRFWAKYLGDSCSSIWVVDVTSLMTRQTVAAWTVGRCDDVDGCALIIRVRTVSWRPRFAL